MILRRAGLGDLRAVFDLTVTFHDEFPHLPPFDAVRAYSALKASVSADLMFIADVGHPVGMLGLLVKDYWYSASLALWDLVFYVHPDHRGSRAAPLLIALAKREAESRKLPLVMATSAAPDPARLDRFFERNGFTRIGGVYEFRE
jgi:GNAT superfamily N-acetyltransferase